MTRIVSRFTREVRSPLIRFQLPPRSVDRKTTLAAVYTTPGETLEKRIGVFHAHRYDGSVPTPRAGLPVATLRSDSRHDLGRPCPALSGCRCKLVRSMRVMLFVVEELFTSVSAKVESFGSTWKCMPSPPPTENASRFETPLRFRTALGMHQLPLSCAPPHTQNGS